MGLFNGMTHAVIFFNTVEGSKTTGVSAMIKLCFGSDENAIAQVLYRLIPGSTTPVWTLPVRTEAAITFPIFRGVVGEEILAAVGRCADRIRKAPNITGRLAGRSFRVTTKTVEEITQSDPTTSPSPLEKP
jgi:hypothetical protein